MDLWRFAVVFIICLLAAIVTQQYVAVFAIGFSLFFAWQYFVLLQLLRWLRKEKGVSPPRQIGVVHNICREIMHTRAQHRQRKAKLTAYLKQYQDAVSAIPDAAVLLGPYDAINWANKKAEEYLGIQWPQDDSLPIINLIRSPQLKQYLACQDEAVLQAGLQMVSPNRPGLKLECRVIHYGVQQKLLIVHDTTTIYRTHQMRRNFVANASHELRTPLTVVSGYLEGLADDAQCPPEWRPRIEQMRKQTDRMQRLIADLLLLSSLESQAAEGVDQPVNVPDVLVAIQQELQPVDDNPQHSFHTEIESSLWIKGNQNDLHSAFANLIGNAIQHTPAGTRIHIRWYRDTTGAHLAVADNGPGIAAEHLSRLSERFYRVGPSGGTGLGLSIVRHALARNTARLRIESQPNAGACFHCDFPLSSIVMQADDAAHS